MTSIDSSPRRARAALLALVVTALASVVVGVNPLLPAAPAQAAPACSATNGITITQVSSPTLWFSKTANSSVFASYIGYRISTNASASIADTWVQLAPVGAGVQLGDREDGWVRLPPLAASSSTFAYFYVKTSAAFENTAQQVRVIATNGGPAGTALCETSFTLNVRSSTEAQANKVDTAVAGPNPAELGGILTLTVTGNTGNMGPGGDNLASFSATPASYPDWPADSYQLVDVRITMTGTGAGSGVWDDVLYVPNLGSVNAAPYTVLYTFIARQATTAPTQITPINHIASGNVQKHTSTTNFTGTGSLAPMLPTENKLTLTKAASPTSLPSIGGTVTYTVTVANAGTQLSSLDAIRDVMPTGATYVTGSSQFQGSSIADPTISGSTLTYGRLFDVPAGASRALTYRLTLPATAGTYTNSAVGYVGNIANIGVSGATQPSVIDTSVDTAAQNPATAAVSVAAPPSPPVANDDTVSAPEDGSATWNLVGNDTDPNGDLVPSTLTVTVPPTRGTISNLGDGRVTYTPSAGYVGADALTYQVCDAGGRCATALVSITVTNTPDAPDAIDDARTTAEDSPITIPVTSNDIDADGDLVATSTVVTAAASNGTAAVNPDGTITYTPTANWNGVDTFTYRVCDATLRCDTAVVTVTVTPSPDAPVANDDTATVPEDGSVVIAVLANDADPDSDLAPGTVTLTSAPSSGTATVLANGTIRYTPAPNATGGDTFAYSVCDATGRCDTALVGVLISAVPDAPVANDDVANGIEDGTVTIDVDANDTDADGDLDPTTTRITTGPTHGTASVNPDGTITYTPNADWHGVDTLTYEICDTTGRCDSAQVTITVTAAPDAPVAIPDSRATDEDTPLSITVATNDTDADGDLDTTNVTLTVLPTNGTATANPDGTITYTPNADWNGVDTLRYRICDTTGRCDTSTVTITVRAVDDTPVARDDTAATVRATPVTVDVLANDIDVENQLDPTTVRITVPPTNAAATVAPDGTIGVTPSSSYVGTVVFTYEVCDLAGNCDTASVTIDVVDDNAPAASDDVANVTEDGTATIGVTTNDTDADGNLDPTDVTVTVAPVHGSATANPDGTITYTPAADWHGIDTLTYEICDTTTRCDTAQVTITVTAVPDTPVANDDTATVVEDGTVTINVAGNDTDPDGDLDPTNVTLTQMPDHGTAIVNPDGTITYTPNADWFGTDTLRYRICDATGRCTTAAVTITVTATTDAPVATDDMARTDAGTAVVVDVASNDTDPDGNLDPTDVTITTAPTHGTATVRPDGRISYVPASGFTGTDTLTYEICDLTGRCDTATVTITVSAVVVPSINGTPRYTGSTTIAGTSGGSLPILGMSDPDADRTTIRVVSGSLPPGTSLLTDGTWSGTPTASGTFSFTVEVCDDGTPVLCSQSLVTVSIPLSAPAPTLVPLQPTTPAATPTTSPAATPTAPAAPATAVPTPGTLPRTGGSPVDQLVLGLQALLAGWLLLGGRRVLRRR